MKPAFGLFDYTMIPKLNRILKPHGLKFSVRRRADWGDQVEIKVVELPTIEEIAAKARKTGKLPRGWVWGPDPNTKRGNLIPMPPEGYGS